jgi:hypothetical protein
MLNPKNLEYGYFQNNPNPKTTTAGTTPAHNNWAKQCNKAETLLLYSHLPVKYSFNYFLFSRANKPYINPNATE